MARAVFIVVPKGNRTYSFDKTVLERLFENDGEEDRKVVSISIAGAMRTGKSFMLNFFLRYLRAQYVRHDISNWLGREDDPLEGFAWHAGLDAVTNGIMIWSEVFLCDDHPSGEKFAIVLMDTQGFFDHKQTTFDHSAIFSLSSIMASTQIYNIMKDLNQSNLNHILQFSKEGIVNMRLDCTTPFQRLVLLIRDGANPSPAKYGLEGGENLLRHRMQGLLGSTVREFFESMECFLIRHPGLDAAESEGFDGRLSRLEPEFVKLLETFVPMILAPEKLTPKILNGQALNSGNFVSNFEFYAAFYSEGAVEGFTGLIDHNCALNALNEAVKEYRKLVDRKRKTPSKLTLALLKSYHDVAKDQSLNYYDDRVKIEPEIAALYRLRLEQEMEKIYERTVQGMAVMIGSNNFEENLVDRFNACVNDVIQKIKEFFPVIGSVLGEIWRSIPDEWKTDVGNEIKKRIVERFVRGVSEALGEI